MRKSHAYILIAVALILGSIAGYAIGEREYKPMLPQTPGMEHSMEAMTANLYNKSGDEFDKAFLDDMIIHHQGAVDMARQVLNKSERTELREMVNAIITAQMKEIETMQGWRTQWFGAEHNAQH